MVSGNDLYLRSGKVGSTEKVVADVMRAVDDCSLKTRRRVVVGMLPRRGPSGQFLSRNIAINRRLADLCVAEGTFFVDPYLHFYGRNDLYQRDGVHLSLKGRAVLSNLLTDTIKRTVASVKPIVISRKVSPERSFARVVVGDKKETGNGKV